LMSNIVSNSSSVVSTIGLRSTLPAVLMAMSIPPNCFFAATNAANDIADFCEITLNGERLAARSVDVGDGLIGIFLGGRAVIVNADPGAISCECVADEAAKILCAASHQDDLFFQ